MNEKPNATRNTQMTDDQIKHMVGRFLNWPLPADFNPDAGISYKRPNYAPGVDATPVGTNLLDGVQAEAMIRHLADGMPDGPGADCAWLIEAPGQHYLSARKVGALNEFHWTQDHDKALRFYSRAQADATMMAVRHLAPNLFSFAVTLGDAKPVEHGWIAA